MQKLKLNLEELQVESFQPAQTRQSICGTVQGYFNPSILDCPTDPILCHTKENGLVNLLKTQTCNGNRPCQNPLDLAACTITEPGTTCNDPFRNINEKLIQPKQ